jgi:fermentation-respiration switch protein FrsA (DUF1100 family)
MRLTIFTLAAAALLAAQAPPPPPPPYALQAEERSTLTADLTTLGNRLSQLRTKAGVDPHLLADVEVHHKAVTWMLRYPEEIYTRAYVANAAMLLKRGIARAEELAAGAHSWTARKNGWLGLAYRSRVDGSVQPYLVVVPEAYDPARPARLDVVLHGRGATRTEVSFLAQAENPKFKITYPDRLELHVFGRTDNSYRWAGETDVFEALAATRARFNIDPARITLRGFSMGGAGTWHIGLHYPSRWAAIEAGAGFTETRIYAKQDDPPPHVPKMWHIYDSVDVARNVFNVPTVGYGGEIDPQLKASVNIREQLEREKLSGVRAIFLVGPQTPHRFHPDSKKESDAFLDKYVVPGRNTSPEQIHFVTYTARYGECEWITIEGLEKHYERAQVDAEGGKIATKNVSRMSVRRGPIEIDGEKFSQGGAFERSGGKWKKAGADRGLRKRPGLQGPIDDAFMDSFIVVKPTTPHAEMDRFLKEFPKWMRGDPRTVEAAQLSDAQIRENNIILFGDAETNAAIKRVLPKLPKKWPADGKSLAIVYPNPLNPKRYVVINSGHTFGEKEFRGTNALLFPRLADWAILNADGSMAETGFFDESWR